MKKIRWFRPLDVLPVLAVLIVAGVWIRLQYAADDGTVVHITTPTENRRLPLSEDMSVTLCGNDGIELTLVIRDEAVSVTTSGCPDQVCVRTHAVSRAGETIVCLPAGIAVTVEGASADVPDAVSR